MTDIEPKVRIHIISQVSLQGRTNGFSVDPIRRVNYEESYHLTNPSNTPSISIIPHDAPSSSIIRLRVRLSLSKADLTLDILLGLIVVDV